MFLITSCKRDLKNLKCNYLCIFGFGEYKIKLLAKLASTKSVWRVWHRSHSPVWRVWIFPYVEPCTCSSCYHVGHISWLFHSAFKQVLLYIIFQNFTEAVMQFSTLVQKRQNDLLDRKQRESVMAAEQMLKKTLPMLSSALQTYAKYPQSAQAVVSMLYHAKC